MNLIMLKSQFFLSSTFSKSSGVNAPVDQDLTPTLQNCVNCQLCEYHRASDCASKCFKNRYLVFQGSGSWVVPTCVAQYT